MQKVHLKRRQATGANAPLPPVADQAPNSCGVASQINHVLVEDRDLSPTDHEVFRTAIGRAVEYVTTHRRERVGALVTLSNGDLDAASARDRVGKAIATLHGAVSLAAPGANDDAMKTAAKDAGDALYEAFGYGGMQNAEAELAGKVLRGNPAAEYLTGGGTDADTMGDELMSESLAMLDTRPEVVTFDSFEAIFENQVSQTLRKGEAAEIGWRAVGADGNGVGGHYVTLGRRRSGAFYLIDQANHFETQADDLNALKAAVLAAIEDHRKCLLAGPRDPVPGSTGESASARRLEAFAPTAEE